MIAHAAISARRAALSFVRMCSIWAATVLGEMDSCVGDLPVGGSGRDEPGHLELSRGEGLGAVAVGRPGRGGAQRLKEAGPSRHRPERGRPARGPYDRRRDAAGRRASASPLWRDTSASPQSAGERRCSPPICSPSSRASRRWVLANPSRSTPRHTDATHRKPTSRSRIHERAGHPTAEVYEVPIEVE